MNTLGSILTTALVSSVISVTAAGATTDWLVDGSQIKPHTITAAQIRLHSLSPADMQSPPVTKRAARELPASRGGSGTGTGSVGSSSPVTLHATVAAALYPGASSPVIFTVDNASPGAQRVGTIHLGGVIADGAHSTCGTSIAGANPDFTMVDVVADQVFPNWSGQAVKAQGTLTMHDTGVDQDACQSATLTFAFTSN
jgi:hypothetical protein